MINWISSGCELGVCSGLARRPNNKLSKAFSAEYMEQFKW